MPAITATNVDVVLGSSRILHDVSLSIDDGESVALLGSNGSGKSTLVRALLGIVPTSSGSIELYGQPVAQRRKIDWDAIGYVPQRVSASSGVPATALEVVKSGLLGPGKRMWAGGTKAALEALDAVGLANRARDHVQVFSGGQSQRVLIARAIVRQPKLLFLDEPLAGIDRESRESLAQLLSSLRAEGLTLVTVLHEMGELAALIERTVVLADGHIIYDGAPEAAPVSLHDCEHPHESPSPTPHHAPRLSQEIR